MRIKKIESRFFGGRHRPTSTNLVIDIDYNGNMEIFREGKVVENSLLSATFDLYFFDISEFPVEMSFSNFRTNNVTAVNGTLNFTISVKNEDDKIRKVFFEEENQLNNLKHQINAEVQTFISNIETIEVRTAAVSLRKFLNSKKDELTRYSSYAIESFNSCILDLANNDDRTILDQIARDGMLNEQARINNIRELNNILHKLKVDGMQRDYDHETTELIRELFMKERGMESYNPEKAMEFDLEKRKIEVLIEKDQIELMKELVKMSSRRENTAEITSLIKNVVDKLTPLFS